MTHLAKALIWLFVFVVPWENVVVIQGVGTAAKLLGFLAGGVGLVAVLLRGRVRHHPFLWAGLLFVAWAWASLLWSVDQPNTIKRALAYTQLWFMAWLVYQYGGRVFLSNLLVAYVLGAWVSALLTVWAYMQGLEVTHQRYAAEGFDPNDLSCFLSVAIPMAAYVGFRAKNLAIRALFLAYIPFSLLAVFLTASRTGAVAATIALLFVLYYLRSLNWKRSLPAVVLLGLAVLFALRQVPPESLSRIGSLVAELMEGTLNKRKIIWAAGLQVFCDHIILGVGAGTFRSAVAPLLGLPVAPHNVFLAVAVEMGILGLALWLLFVTLSCAGVLRLPSPERQVWGAVLLILAVSFLSLNFEWRKITWLVLALAASFGAAVRSQGKSERGEATTSRP